jgi:hypothetical protein
MKSETDRTMTLADAVAALDSTGVAYAVVNCEDCAVTDCHADLDTRVIRATDKACAVVLVPKGRRFSAAVRLPRVQTAEAHSGWPYGLCCPFATSRRLHVSVWADIADDATVCIPAGGSRISMKFGDLVKALVALKLLGRLDRRSSFVN